MFDWIFDVLVWIFRFLFYQLLGTVFQLTGAIANRSQSCTTSDSPIA